MKIDITLDKTNNKEQMIVDTISDILNRYFREHIKEEIKDGNEYYVNIEMKEN